MKKRILFVIDSLVCGGAEKSLVSLLPLLNQDKYEIHLWILHRGKVFESLLTDDVIIEPEPNYNLFERVLMHIGKMRYSFLYRVMQAAGKHEHMAETLWKCIGRVYKTPESLYDVAVAYQQGVPTYLVATGIKAKRKIGWINADIFAAGYDKDFNAHYYNKLDVIVPVSNELKTILVERLPQYADKYQCIYDILNPDLILQQSREPIEEKYFSNDKLTYIVTTGRLAAAKNYQLAVESARIIHEKGIPFVWLFIGEGEERPLIEKLLNKYNLQNNVILLGERTNPYPYMAHCDIYVQTSIFEGFGLTVAEAKILGKPIVSTNFDVVYEQLIHKENGLIAEMTPESVAMNIIQMIEDTDLRTSIQANLQKEKNTTHLTEVKKVERILDAD